MLIGLNPYPSLFQLYFRLSSLVFFYHSCCCFVILYLVLYNINLRFCFKLQADALVCSVGATSQAIITAGVSQMTTPNAGDIAVSPGSPLAKHVINTCCGQWNGGKGEAVSIFFFVPETDPSKRSMSRGGTVA